MNPNLMHQMAQDRQADLQREAEKYRRAGPTARPTVLVRITARIPRFRTRSRRSQARVVVPSTPKPPDPGGAAQARCPLGAHCGRPASREKPTSQLHPPVPRDALEAELSVNPALRTCSVANPPLSTTLPLFEDSESGGDR